MQHASNATGNDHDMLRKRLRIHVHTNENRPKARTRYKKTSNTLQHRKKIRIKEESSVVGQANTLFRLQF